MAATHLDYETLTNTYGKALVDKQIALEERMAGLGNNEFHRQLDKARQKQNEANTVYGNALLAHAIDPVANAIRAFIAEAQSGKAGRRHLAVQFLEATDPEVAALLALRTILDGITSKRVLQTVAVAIGTRIEAENRYRKLAEEADRQRKEEEDLRLKFTVNYVDRKIKKASTFRHRKNVLSAVMEKAGVEWQSWTDTERLHLGLKLVELVIDSVGLVEIVEVVVRQNKTNKYLTVSDKTMDWITRQIGRCELLTPTALPTLIPPRAWTGPTAGGYHTAIIPQVPLVKISSPAYLEELANRVDAMPVLYDAVNAIQNTPWQINQPVLDVARQLWDNGVAVAGLPEREDTSHVQCPKCHAPVPLGQAGEGRRKKWTHECFNEDAEALAAWKRRAAQVHEANIAVRSKRVQIQKTLWCAEIYEKEDRFYMPYQLDFRGRIYAIPFFNPQGHDLMKGLLTFADGKPITDGTAAGWLAIHGANVYGFDKASLEDRIQWVEDRNEMIREIAADPYGTMGRWTEADKPFQFLAFCFEWAGFLEQGYGYVSHLPVALDGSCSGIQHFSAMLRDPVGGAAVNLLPAEVPSDIYGRVAQVVVEKLCLEVSTRGENAKLAQQLLDLEIDRKATKRQVMTLPYGSTIYSCREYTEQWMWEHRGDRLPWDAKGVFKASQYLSKLIWDSIGEVVIAARQAMDWLQSCAKVVAKEGLPVTWTTPVGFPVMQRYPEMKQKRVKSKLGDSIIKLTLREEQEQIDRKRMASGISPNFVHSMDAAHLMLSVDYATQNKVTHFAMIHDSFGSHAADAEMMGSCLRHAFVDMYRENDVLEQFRESILAQVEEERREDIQPVPEKSNLDLDRVLESDFFFA